VRNHQTDNVAGTDIQYVVTNSDTNMHAHTPLYSRQNMSKPLTLGIDLKTKGMIRANEFAFTPTSENSVILKGCELA
jgi:hypothetical protein